MMRQLKQPVLLPKIKRQVGLSILEALLTLLAVAVMITASVIYFRQAEYQTQVAAFLNEMKGVAQAASQYNEINNSFYGLSIEDIVRMNTIVPRYNVVLKGGTGGDRLPVPWTGASQSGYIPGVMVMRSSREYVCLKIQRIKASVCQPIVEQLIQFMDVYITQATITEFCQHQGGSDVYLSYPRQENGYPLACLN